MTRRYWLLLTLTIFLALTLAACGGKGDKTSPTEEAAAPAAQATAPKTAAKTEPTAAPQKKACPRNLPTNPPKHPRRHPRMSRCPWRRVTRPGCGTSYRLTWHAEWKSADQGKEEQGSLDRTEEYTSDPKARHLSMTHPRFVRPRQDGAFVTWQIGDTSYMKSGEDEE